jgi:O-antigen ligase
MTLSETDIADRPDRRAERADGPTLPFLGLSAAVLVAAVATGVMLARGASKFEVLVPSATFVVVAFALFTYHRFELLVAGALVMRASLDSVKVGSGTGNGTDPASLLAIVFLLAAALWLSANRKEERLRFSSVVPPMGALLVACLISAAGAQHRQSAFVEFARIFAAIAMFVVLEQLIRRGASRILLTGAMFASAIVPVLVGAFQLLQRQGLVRRSDFDRVPGTFLHPNPYAIYLAIIVIMGAVLVTALESPWNRRLAAVLIGATVMMLATYTRTAWIAAFLGLAFIGLIQRRLRLLGVLVGLAAVAVMAIPSVGARFSDLGQEEQQSGEAGNSLIWRTQYWGDAATLAEGSEITGIGLAEVRQDTDEQKAPHNDFLRMFIEAGVVGLAAYVWLLVGLYRRTRARLAETRAALAPLARSDPALARLKIERALCVGFAGTLLAFVVVSAVSNVISQVVLLWYFFGFAAVALTPGPEHAVTGSPA